MKSKRQRLERERAKFNSIFFFTSQCCYNLVIEIKDDQRNKNVKYKEYTPHKIIIKTFQYQSRLTIIVPLIKLLIGNILEHHHYYP